MARSLKIGVVQMDIAPAPLAERLERAEKLVTAAAAEGAQLVALPEVFNTGYAYHDANYPAAETLDGPTANWMRATAAQAKVHLAGTLLLKDGDHVYNTALLFAPDGRLWRYDKNYPFGWERAYFREGDRITVADTDLGKLGLMICWDSAHPELWQRYAGQVEGLLILSCPPGFNRLSLRYPDDTVIQADEMGLAMQGVAVEEGYFAAQDIEEQTRWLGVPAVHSSGSGAFSSAMPQPHLSVGLLSLLRPDLYHWLSRADEVRLEAVMPTEAKIIHADGSVAARVNAAGDGYTVAEVTLPDTPPAPKAVQPQVRTPLLAFIINDMLTPALLVGKYREGLRRQWGASMAPVDFRTRAWTVALVLAALAGYLTGRFERR